MGIRLLANELGLSIGTVSRALNDRPDVSPATRARVKAAAARAGYVPNQSGRSLRSGRTGIVAAVIPTGGLVPSADSGLFKVLEGVRRTLLGRALDLIVLFRGPEEDPLENLQRIVQRRIVDAVIISQTTAADPRLAYLKAAGVGFVAFGRSAGVDDYPYVDFDVESAAAEAVEVFAADGHRRLGLALGQQRMNYEDVLAAAFVAAAERNDLEPVQVFRTREARLGAEARAILADRGRAPTAFLAAHESIAAGLYADLAAARLRIGEDVSVVCIFPTIDTRSLTPELAHFDADLDAVGVALADRLIAMHPEVTGAPPEPLLVPLRFAPRASGWRAARRLRA